MVDIMDEEDKSRRDQRAVTSFGGELLATCCQYPELQHAGEKNVLGVGNYWWST